MIKTIAILVDKDGTGSYGVADDEPEALSKAKKEWSGGRRKPTQTHYRTVDVPDGHRLVVSEGIRGISWWTEPTTTT
jgi:hypothetical protein